VNLGRWFKKSAIGFSRGGRASRDPVASKKEDTLKLKSRNGESTQYVQGALKEGRPKT